MDLPDDLREVAFHELNETQATKDASIERLRKLLENEMKSGLYSRTDTVFLLKFLRARKFDVDRAFTLLKNYYGYRSRHRKIFQDLLPSALHNNLRYNYQTLLPGRDRKGRAILVVKSGLWDPLEYGADEMFRTNLLCVEHAIQDVETQVRGIVLLNDLQGMSLHHVRHCPPTHFIKIIHLIQDAFPGRFKAVHLVHEPSVARALLTVLLPLIKPKLQTRIMFHGSDMSSLHEHISPEVLPQEYGGGGGHMDNQDFVAALLEGEESFRRDLQYGYADK